MNVFRILPIALALFAGPSLSVIPSISEGPGRAVVRLATPQASQEAEYRQPRIIHQRGKSERVRTTQAIPTTPLRGAVTPRAPAA